MLCDKFEIKRFLSNVFGLPSRYFQASTNYGALGKSQSYLEPRSQTIRFIWINICIFFVYLAIFALAVYDLLFSRHEAGLIFSPARAAVSYETRIFDNSVLTEFKKGPAMEVDSAWHELLKYNNIVIQEDDLKKLNRTSVPLSDGSGYLGGLDVFHELHCLNYIRESVYSDYYTTEAEKHRTEHLYHCIDSLRQTLMCHSDITVHTFEWDEEVRIPLMKPVLERECRKWEPIVEWAIQHQPSRKNGSILEHPVFGPIHSETVNKTQA